MRLAFDTNILAYAEGYGHDDRADTAQRLTISLRPHLVLPAQVIGELYNVLSRKARWSQERVRQSIDVWSSTTRIATADWPVFAAALTLAADHKLQIWDAVILETALSAGCTLLLSEDMQHGFSRRGLTVVNPFLPDPHPRLAAALTAAR